MVPARQVMRSTNRASSSGRNNRTADAVLNLADEQCRWPIGHPNEDNFKFCSKKKMNSNCPYCLDHWLKRLPSKTDITTFKRFVNRYSIQKL